MEGYCCFVVFCCSYTCMCVSQCVCVHVSVCVCVCACLHMHIVQCQLILYTFIAHVHRSDSVIMLTSSYIAARYTHTHTHTHTHTLTLTHTTKHICTVYAIRHLCISQIALYVSLKLNGVHPTIKYTVEVEKEMVLSRSWMSAVGYKHHTA